MCVNQEARNQQGTHLRQGIAYESVSLALALLVPGAYTYRYGPTAYKVAVGRHAAQGLLNLGDRLEGVKLRVDDADHFEAAANCPSLQPRDLPPDFPSTGQPVPVYTPRQVHLIWVPDQPKASITTALVADNDAAPSARFRGSAPGAAP